MATHGSGPVRVSDETAPRPPLAGHKVAVIVESQFIPDELRMYRDELERYGARVDLVSNLWGNERLRFYSTVEPDAAPAIGLEWIEVGVDVTHAHPGDYAGVIVAANYPTVRLRYVEPEPGVGARAQAQNAPAVDFFYRAMQDRTIVKAAPCHALWLLTPHPEALAGRHITCNPVVVADLLNAGAVYHPFYSARTPVDQQVYIDDDLITSTSWHASRRLVDAVKDGILARRGGRPDVSDA
jgi:putative intracellular protease/amidase